MQEANVETFDYLLIDVEGWELEVMQGFNASLYSPKVIVLENNKNIYNILTKMDERIFVADPFGKIILGYKSDFVAKGLLKDIKKLLKFSKI